jgi:hypothetical protein
VTIGWSSVAGAASYNVYRSVNQGPYSKYATVTAKTASAAYGDYVAKSGMCDVGGSNIPCPYQTSVDSAYQDTAATNAVASAVGPRPVYWPNTGYTYKVSAVVDGEEGALSTDSILVFFANGLRIGCEDVFDPGTMAWSEAAPATSPMGYSTAARWQPTPA